VVLARSRALAACRRSRTIHQRGENAILAYLGWLQEDDAGKKRRWNSTGLSKRLGRWAHASFKKELLKAHKHLEGVHRTEKRPGSREISDRIVGGNASLRILPF